MGTVTKRSTTSIAAGTEDVWTELDDNFLEISRWAGGVNTSVANPATPKGFNGSPHGGRICDVDGIGKTDERIINYDHHPATSKPTSSKSTSSEKFSTHTARRSERTGIAERFTSSQPAAARTSACVPIAR